MKREVDIDNQFGWDNLWADKVHDYVSPYDGEASTPYRKPTPFIWKMEANAPVFTFMAEDMPSPRKLPEAVGLRAQWRALKRSLRVREKYCPQPGQPVLSAHQIWIAGLEVYEEIEGNMRGSLPRSCANDPAIVRKAKILQAGLELQESYVQIMLACESTIEAMGLDPVACPWPRFVPPPI